MKQNNIIKPHSKLLRTFFFLSGILATIAYRIIIMLNIYAPKWTNAAWYIGTIGFIIYFGHRYNIQEKKEELVKKHNLLSAVEKPELKGKQKQALDYIVRTTLTSKSRWNSAFILILSTIALIIGIIIDFLI